MKPKKIAVEDICLDPVSGFLRVDKIPVLKVVNINGEKFVQFKDGVEPRVEYRGSNLVEIPLGDFIACLARMGEQFDG